MHPLPSFKLCARYGRHTCVIPPLSKSSRCYSMTTRGSSRPESNLASSGNGEQTPRLSDGPRHNVRAELKSKVKSRLGPLSPEAALLRREMRTTSLTPAEALRTHFQNSNAISTDVVRVCLSQLTWPFHSQPRNARMLALQSLKTAGAARLILTRIWAHENYWIPIAIDDENAMDDLCLLAVAEGLDKLIMDWIFTTVSERTEKAKPYWRGKLLRALVMTHLKIGIYEKTADPALKCLFEVLSRKQKLDKELERLHQYKNGVQRPQIGTISFFPAIIACQHYITGQKNFNDISPSLYDNFTRFCWSYLPNKNRSREYGQATLLLWHPTAPEEQLALKLLRQHRDGVESEIPDLHDPKMVVAFKRFLQRTITVAEMKGNTADADWVEENYREYLTAEDPQKETRST